MKEGHAVMRGGLRSGPETTLRELHPRNREDMEPRNAMWPSVTLAAHMSAPRLPNRLPDRLRDPSTLQFPFYTATSHRGWRSGSESTLDRARRSINREESSC